MLLLGGAMLTPTGPVLPPLQRESLISRLRERWRIRRERKAERILAARNAGYDDIRLKSPPGSGGM
jgi:hypothetical protein